MSNDMVFIAAAPSVGRVHISGRRTRRYAGQFLCSRSVRSLLCFLFNLLNQAARPVQAGAQDSGDRFLAFALGQ